MATSHYRAAQEIELDALDKLCRLLECETGGLLEFQQEEQGMQKRLALVCWWICRT
ncbi:MAG: helix-turn-helix domain-containing protein [Gammaproteobacteria bacterium]|nr:helix-turn-helix domain-containing protein [Gammaproteobacteria bacterium]